MFYKLRRMSPFTIFWVLFYTLAITALIVPWEVGKWLAYAAFTPSLIVALVGAVGISLLVLMGLCDWAVKLYRAKKGNSDAV